MECGFCEPVCPSRSLTLTPRQRIVLRREREAALARGDHALVASLDEDYDYDGLATCAADGMCATACPVLINTGDLVKRLRAEGSSRTAERAWTTAAGHWGAATAGRRRGAVGRRPAARPRPGRPLACGSPRGGRGARAALRPRPGRRGRGTPRPGRPGRRGGAVQRLRGHDVRWRCRRRAPHPGRARRECGSAPPTTSPRCAAAPRGSPRGTATGTPRMAASVRESLRPRHRRRPAAGRRRRQLVHRGAGRGARGRHGPRRHDVRPHRTSCPG